MVPDENLNGTLLWVNGASESRKLLESVAGELNLCVSFHGRGEALEIVEHGSWKVVGIELDDEPGESLALIKKLQQRAPQLPIFAASADASISMIRAAMDAGAKDLVALPLDEREVHKALIKLFSQPSGPKMHLAPGASGEVITIHGVRGGLGATTTAINLAVRLASLTGSKVALVDLDLQRCDVAAFLNLDVRQSVAALAAAHGEIDEVFLHTAMTKHASGVSVLAAPVQMEEADTIGHEQIEVAIRLLRAQFAYVVVDTARTLTDATLAAVEQTDRMFILTDLSVPGVRAARRTLDLLVRLDIRPELLVTHAVPGPIKLEDAVRAIGRKPYMVIPRDSAAASGAMNAGAPLNGNQDSALAVSLTEFANKLAGVRSDPRGGHLLSRLFGKGRRAHT
jgi:pilus assembly protein CpaE